jgi:hypothetical protein
LPAGRAPNFISYLLSSIAIPERQFLDDSGSIARQIERSSSRSEGAQRTLMSRASISFSMPGTGLVAHSTKRI